VTSRVRRVPWGIVVFLAYAFAILTGIGLSLRFVIDQAIAAPVSPIGVVVMALLAYTIFSVTVVLQRKAAGRGFALGLSTLTLPLILLAVIGAQPIVAVFLAALAALLFRGLMAPAVIQWLDQE
jgi:hypothetical protein